MLLLVDAGNTRVKWALSATGMASGGNWEASGNVGHEALDELGRCWQDAQIDTVLVSNVAGPRMQAALAQQFSRLPAGPQAPAVRWFASLPEAAGVRNGYREPQRLGCDRFASLIGARALQPSQPLLVVTCGTATTIDALTADGHFIGGMILPGLGTMAASLAQNTAQLPALSGSTELIRLAQEGGGPNGASRFADNTESAIVQGCLNAQAGAIERAVAAHEEAHCFLAGGAAAWVLPYLQVKVTLVENLVLIGLHAVANGPDDHDFNLAGLPDR